jgi:PAS domain S-box-containing protein
MSPTAETHTRSASSKRATRPASTFWRSAGYAALGSVAVGIVTLVGFRLHADAAAVALLYLFVIVLTSLWADMAAALVVSLIAVVSLDYFFTAPLFSVSIGEIDAVAIVVFSTTAVVIARLMSRVRKSFQEIQAREAMLREQASLLDLTHDTVFVRDMSDVITYWNRGAEELYGWNRDEAVGQVSHQLLHTIFPAPLDEITAALIRTGRWEGALVQTKRDGTHITVASRWSLQQDEKGRLLGTLETNNDITERQRVEEAVRRQASLLDQTHDAIVVWEFPRTIIFWNRGAEQLYGFSKEEAIGRSSHELLHTDHPLPTSVFEAALERAGEWTGELTHTTRDGRKILVESRHVLMREADGRHLVLETNRDITERKHAEEAARKAQEELAHVARVTTLGEMAASIAHEVDQPLSGVVINANASLRFLTSASPNLDEVRDGLQAIARDGRRASDVIGRIRALARRTSTEKEPLDINEVIREVVALAEGEARRARARCRTELAGDLPRVVGDRVQLQQVVLNLLLNGLEAMHAVVGRPRDLVISSQREATDRVRVAVQDSGSGIDPQFAPRMFEAFYTTKPGGLGMGLSISRSIVEQHGGRLWAVPNDGHGTTFQFTVCCTNGEVSRA